MEYHNKRQRGRGRNGGKPGGGGGGGGGGHHPNRAMESNGPDIKVRGPAAHIYERYLQLARDASAAGDRVMGENYLQHAEHYFRLWRLSQPALPPPPPVTDRFGASEQDFDDDNGGADNTDAQGERPQGVGDQPDAEFANEGGQQNHNNRNNQDDDFRRRRGRRNRFQPGDREGGDMQARDGNRDGHRDQNRDQNREGGDQRRNEGDQQRRPERGERQDRPERAERQERPPQAEGDAPPPRERAPRQRREPRENAGEAAPEEGFSNGPRPAFLGSD